MQKHQVVWIVLLVALACYLVSEHLRDQVGEIRERQHAAFAKWRTDFGKSYSDNETLAFRYETYLQESAAVLELQ